MRVAPWLPRQPVLQDGDLLAHGLVLGGQRPDSLRDRDQPSQRGVHLGLQGRNVAAGNGPGKRRGLLPVLSGVPGFQQRSLLGGQGTAAGRGVVQLPSKVVPAHRSSPHLRVDPV